ncbi:hypothetical protein BT96DRAFT_936846 [Gymnopus androsaceus JB14]|uniref:Uncharacterized protein n=1 Tax=Gymnopus androsaceus JB14 TaxID=1447944 RepID=A0A6A4HZ08_9AGAR|nr:hypothetical protein BT96DRAFT_936846 [Gymnopus androsaceus JB14]
MFKVQNSYHSLGAFRSPCSISLFCASLAPAFILIARLSARDVGATADDDRRLLRYYQRGDEAGFSRRPESMNLTQIQIVFTHSSPLGSHRAQIRHSLRQLPSLYFEKQLPTAILSSFLHCVTSGVRQFFSLSFARRTVKFQS